MAEPITIATAAITGLVGAYTAYTEYKAAAAKAEAERAAPPTKTEEVAKGEQVAEVLETGIQQHGKPDEQIALAGYRQNPELFESALSKAIADIAERAPAFVQQLQALAPRAGAQGSGVQGNVNVGGEGRVYGTATGVNSGTISGTYSFGDEEQNK